MPTPAIKANKYILSWSKSIGIPFSELVKEEPTSHIEVGF